MIYDRLIGVSKKINWNLYWAVAAFEAFVPTARDEELIAFINANALHPTFNVISDSLHRRIVMEVCKVWDNTRGAASLIHLAKLLRRPATLEAIKGNTFHNVDENLLQRFFQALDLANHFEPLQTLQQSRNRVLAHSEDSFIAPTRPVRTTVYGDERNVIEMTIPVVEMANEIVGYNPIIPYAEAQPLWSRYCQDFWLKTRRDPA